MCCIPITSCKCRKQIGVAVSAAERLWVLRRALRAGQIDEWDANMSSFLSESLRDDDSRWVRPYLSPLPVLVIRAHPRQCPHNLPQFLLESPPCSYSLSPHPQVALSSPVKFNALENDGIFIGSNGYKHVWESHSSTEAALCLLSNRLLTAAPVTNSSVRAKSHGYARIK